MSIYDEWIKKMWFIHTTEYESKGILQYTTKWINTENILLSEINQLQKAKYCMFLSKIIKLIEAKNRIASVVAQNEICCG